MADQSIRFGLTNVHYAVYDDFSIQNEDNPKYLKPVRMHGAVSLSLSREGDTTVFYADNGPYASKSVNGGYTGTIELANLEDQVLTDLCGSVVDDNGLVIEDTNGAQRTFALLFEVQSNDKPQRIVLYNCTMSRPEADENTTSDSFEVSTQSLEIAAIAREFKVGGTTINAIKAHKTRVGVNDDADPVYKNFFEEVLVPTTLSAQDGD